VRVSGWVPFGRAVGKLAFSWQAEVSDETAQRLTDKAGAA